MSENDCSLVSSRGLLRSCKVHCPNPVSSCEDIHELNFAEITPRCTVYVCAELKAIRDFLSRLETDIVLVTGDSDMTVTQEIADEVLSNPRIICWWAQNLVAPSRRLRHLPIGQDYHTMRVPNAWGPVLTPREQERLLYQLGSKSKPPRQRRPLCYANFQFQMGSKYAWDRRDAMQKIPADCIFYEPNRIGRRETWEAQVQYAFVVSPHGNGYDCHRTWEGLALGCYVIVKSSALNPLFAGLPVVIVSDWAEVTSELLRQVIDKFEHRKFAYDKLTLRYWTKKIQQSAQ